MLTRNRSDNQYGSNFDAIQFELERERIFEQSNKPLSKYEIDRDLTWNSRLYRV